NTCVQCLGSSDCNGGTCSNGQCQSTNTPGGDTCLNPGTLNLSSGQTTVTGDLSSANHDIQGLCGGNGRDVVYRFTLSSPKDFAATVTAVTTGMRPVIYLATACGGGTELRCNTSGTGASATITHQELPAGTYYLWVDSTAGFPQGQFSLQVSASEPPPPVAGDTCGNPLTLSFNSAGNATVTGTTAGAKADYTSVTCSSTGADVVYTFTTPFTGPFSATVTPHVGTGHRPALYLLSRCPRQTSGDEVACATASSSGGTGTLSLGSLPAGTYFLVVDGVSGSGAFDLSASRATSNQVNTGENCSSVIPLTFTNNEVTVSGSTIGRQHDTASSNTNCGGGSAPDVVYSFNNPVANGAVQINIKNKTPGWTPSIYMRSSCSSNELACNYARAPGADGLLLIDKVPAGQIYLWIDGKDSSSGAFDLTVRVNVPVYGTGGESCSSVLPITLIEGVAIGRGTLTSSHVDNQSSTCSTAGKDVVYRFDLPSGRSRLLGYVAADNSTTWAPAVHLMHGTPCSGAASMKCGAGSVFFQSWASAEVTNPPAGTWYLWVEGASSSDVGPYYFEVYSE
ncbi:MAG: hypothetical protein ACK4N5_13995, partial [Myxococcales bacterium]